MKKRWLLVAGAPLFSSCGTAPFNCPGQNTVTWDGLLPNGAAWDGGGISTLDCEAICADGGVSGHTCTPKAGAIDCTSICRGRSPPGALALSRVDRSVGSWIAQGAEFEAAAVYAFEQLAFELEVHGLPAFAAAARVAACDEVRHARVTTGLALRFGACPKAPRVELPPQPRSLEEIALDNAAEGCGRELLGVEINRWQASHAADGAVRSAMAVIAEEEASHARLSFALAEALAPRLTTAVRRRAREAQERALLGLAAFEAPAAVRSSFGLMDPEQATAAARRLLDVQRLAG